MPYDVQLVAGNGAGCGKISRSRRFFTREGGKNIFFARFVALQFFFEGSLIAVHVSYGQLNEWRTNFVNETIVAKMTKGVKPCVENQAQNNEFPHFSEKGRLTIWKCRVISKRQFFIIVLLAVSICYSSKKWS